VLFALCHKAYFFWKFSAVSKPNNCGLGGESLNSWISQDIRYHSDLKAQRSKKLWHPQAIFANYSGG
jgi:hypothetical protein